MKKGKPLMGANKMRQLANQLSEQTPGMCFALFVFPANQPGIASYISNGTREDMIKALEEKLARFKGDEDFKTPEEN